MSLSQKELENIARLARLKIAGDDLQSVAEDLTRILDFVERLSAADTADVTPMAHPLPGMTQRLRRDEAMCDSRRDEYQKNAPAVEDGLYLVPRVIE